MTNAISRRALLAGTALLAGATEASGDTQNAARLKVSIFSKHLQFLHGEELARSAAEMGFDGIDLTVRRGGHVAPERVRQDLPPLVSAIRKNGLDVFMVTTDIVDADTPYAEDILRTLAQLKIRYYRWGPFPYVPHRPYAAQLEELIPRIARLAALNARRQVCAIYHTHSGAGLVGASVWDLAWVLKGFDANAVAVNYDVGHATVEGGLGGWINSFQIVRPHLRGIAVKDFVWGKGAQGEWQPQWKPLGTGMVRFPQFFAMVAEAGFAGPLQIYFEYPLGGANDGKETLTIAREEVFAAMKRDLETLRGYLSAAKL